MINKKSLLIINLLVLASCNGVNVKSGYANGTCREGANYKSVCTGKTGFRETVRVEYDPEKISLDAILLAYFYVIDPTVRNRLYGRKQMGNV